MACVSFFCGLIIDTVVESAYTVVVNTPSTHREFEFKRTQKGVSHARAVFVYNLLSTDPALRDYKGVLKYFGNNFVGGVV